MKFPKEPYWKTNYLEWNPKTVLNSFEFPPILYVEVPDPFVEVFGALLSKVMFEASPASQKAPGTESDWQRWRIRIPKSTKSLPSQINSTILPCNPKTGGLVGRWFFLFNRAWSLGSSRSFSGTWLLKGVGLSLDFWCQVPSATFGRGIVSQLSHLCWRVGG